jgi:hypothetical protein
MTVSSDQPGAVDAELLKDDDGDEGTSAEGGQETITPEAEQVTPPAADPAGQQPDIRVELAKRFGEGKSDQEYLEEAWKSYRNGETTFSQTQAKVKEYEELVNQFGGAEVLRRALENPAPQQPAGEKPAGQQYPAKIQPLIDQGLLNPEDPIAQLLIDQERRLEQSQQIIGQSTHERAVQTFDTWLKATAAKYEFADIDAIKELGFKGAFANMTDAQAQAAIDQIANRQHQRVTGLVEGRTQAKLDELKGLNEKKILNGKPGGGKPTTLTPRQAFEAKHAEYFKE